MRCDMVSCPQNEVNVVILSNEDIMKKTVVKMDVKNIYVVRSVEGKVQLSIVIHLTNLVKVLVNIPCSKVEHLDGHVTLAGLKVPTMNYIL